MIAKWTGNRGPSTGNRQPILHVGRFREAPRKQTEIIKHGSLQQYGQMPGGFINLPLSELIQNAKHWTIEIPERVR